MTIKSISLNIWIALENLGLFKVDFWDQIKGQLNYLDMNLNQIKGQIKYLGLSLNFYHIKGFIKYLGSTWNQIKGQVKYRGLHLFQIKV